MERGAVAWEDFLNADDQPDPGRGPKRRRWLLVLLAAGVCLITATVAAALLLAPGTRTAAGPGDEPAAPASPEPAAPGAGTPDQPAPDQPAPDRTTDAPAPAGDTTTWRWELTGMILPVSSTAGPANLGDLASGFQRSELGAALAAAHLSVRVDPAAGPDVYRPTIEQQMTGDTARVLAAVDAAHTAGVAPRTAPSMLGYRVEGYTGDTATVHLQVGTPGGAVTDFAVPLAWDAGRGDWLLTAPAADATALFATAQPSGDYTPYVIEETQ